MKRLALVALVCFSFSIVSAVAEGIADTPENRRVQAERYLAASSPKTMFEDMAKKMSANLPADQRAQFVELFTSKVDIDALTKAMTEAMVKHFSAEELKALADFYGSPVGKSAMSKFGDYMADLMPTIQKEIISAQGRMQEAQQKK